MNVFIHLWKIYKNVNKVWRLFPHCSVKQNHFHSSTLFIPPGLKSEFFTLILRILQLNVLLGAHCRAHSRPPDPYQTDVFLSTPFCLSRLKHTTQIPFDPSKFVWICLSLMVNVLFFLNLASGQVLWLPIIFLGWDQSIFVTLQLIFQMCPSFRNEGNS